MEQQIHRKALLSSLLVIMIIATTYVLYPSEEETGSSSVSMILQFHDHGVMYKGNLTIWDDGKILNSNHTTDNSTTFEFRNVTGENQSVFSTLITISRWANFTVEYREHGSEKGTFIESIAGIENDKHTWQYYINEEYGHSASDTSSVRDGDVIVWSYE